MELFRALAVLAEPPDRAEVARIAELLGLGDAPSPSEYAETFIFQLYPYASVYLGAEGMLGGAARDRVAGFFHALGRTPPADADHLSVLLATYAQLSSTAGGGDEGEGARGREMGGGDSRLAERLRAARKAFLWEHLLSWLPVYLDRLARVAPAFYRRWGELLLSALTEEASECGPPSALPLHLREAPPLADPRISSSDEFLQTLLAPARSGFVLTRSDLARAARALGAGLRAGERKFVLKSLFGQDAAGLLAWMAEEASACSARHARRCDAFGELAAWWSARAASTGELLRELAADAETRDAEL